MKGCIETNRTQLFATSQSQLQLLSGKGPICNCCWLRRFVEDSFQTDSFGTVHESCTENLEYLRIKPRVFVEGTHMKAQSLDIIQSCHYFLKFLTTSESCLWVQKAWGFTGEVRLVSYQWLKTFFLQEVVHKTIQSRSSPLIDCF